ncbi:MAG: hypothetical protein ACPGQL_08515 [Thermoplasmatota archaeon]
MTHATINEGALHLLSESCRLLGPDLDNVLIVGGWGTFLRNQEWHPGSRDVDVLFPPDYSRDQMKKVVLRFLDDGFLVSAKHDFQIMKAIQVGGRRYLYNVDFLHPKIEKQNIVEYQDLIQFDETLDGHLVKKAQSIGIREGHLLFEEQLFERRSVDNYGPRFLDGAGIIISKISACMNLKRRRDIYDMALEWDQAASDIEGRIRRLATDYRRVSRWLKKTVGFNQNEPSYFRDCIRQYADPFNRGEQAEKSLVEMFDSFESIAHG